MPAAPPTPYAPFPAAPAVGMPAGGVDLRRGLATALTVMFSLMIPALVLVLIGEGGQHQVASDFLDNPFSVTQEEIDDADDFALGASFIYGLIGLTVAILWAIWFRRLRLNAEVFAPGTHRFGSGWAAGSWFTPVVNLWFPKQIANDIWRASSPQGPQQVRRGLLNGWWVTFMVAMVVNLISNVQYTVNDRKLEDMQEDAKRGKFVNQDDAMDAMEGIKNSLGVSMFSTVILIAAAILGLLLVRQITAMQEQRAVLPPAPAPYGMGAAPYGMPGAAPYGAMPGAAPYGAPAPPPAAPYSAPTQPGGAPAVQPGPYPPYGSGPTGN
ncbi:DUF4328 domain-containing protein [Streptomyces sp. LX-29]|uniref:DUF4328 domain-containing protein n=1 Tax=Streptomyces sp. LX-29 TaxID=2900152 RepID=UPI00240E4B75|nr:DUF4328 domain-containing protein [Streptomyces sp. LX-29]WFB09006.1 DUF4328 domain-containing protein [Streptomyces sp. LX-29]